MQTMATPSEVQLFQTRLSRGFYSWNVKEVYQTVMNNPKVLSNCGNLALQRACDMDQSIVSIKLIRLLIEEGSRLPNFGPRGGLRLSFNHNSSPLQALVKRGSLPVLKFLSEAQPPLLCQEDVSTFNLLHYAAGYGHVDVVNFLISLDPDAVFSHDEHGALPIHMTCRSGMDAKNIRIIRKILIKECIQHSHFHVSADNNNNNMQQSRDQAAIDVLESFFPNTNTNACKDAITSYIEDIAAIVNGLHGSIPLLCAAIHVGAPHTHIKCIINLLHDAAKVRDGSNRLPIHLATECGIQWSQGLSDIVAAYPSAVNHSDGKTQLSPYALAATSCDLDGIFELMIRNPESINLNEF
jgi:ankyrin repeat protein